MDSFNGLKNPSFLIAVVVRWHFGVLLQGASRGGAVAE